MDTTGKQLEAWSARVIGQSQQEMHAASASMGRMNPLVGVQQVGATVLEGVVGLVGLAGKGMETGAGGKLLDTLSHPIDLATTLVKGLVQGGKEAYQNAGPFAVAGYVATFGLGGGGALKGANALKGAEAAGVGGRLGEVASAAGKVAEAAKPLTMDFVSGTVDSAIATMLKTAQETGRPVEATLNGTKLLANPGDTAALVKAPLTRANEAAAAQAAQRTATAARVRETSLQAFTSNGGKVVSTPPPGLLTDARGALPPGGFNGTSETLHLLTPEQLQSLPKGTEVVSINGQKLLAGIDKLDGDTRGGFTAFGFPDSALKTSTGAPRPLSLTFSPGTNLNQAASDLLGAANRTGRPVEGSFNGVKLTANPGEAVETVRAPMDQHLAQGLREAKQQEAARAGARQGQLDAFTNSGGKLVSSPPTGLVTDPRGVIPPKSLFNAGQEPLHLLTPDQLKGLPKGTELVSIDGKKVVAGIDSLSDDTRGGFTAYGFPDSALKRGPVGATAESKVAAVANTSHSFSTEGIAGGAERFRTYAGSNLDQVLKDAEARVAKTGVPLEGSFNGHPVRIGPGDTAESAKAGYWAAVDKQAAAERAAQTAAVDARAQALSKFVDGGGKLRNAPPADVKLSPAGVLGDDVVLLKPSQVAQLPRGTELMNMTTGKPVVVGFDSQEITSALDASSNGFSPLGFKLENVQGAVTQAPARSVDDILRAASKNAKGTASSSQSLGELMNTSLGVAVQTLSSGNDIRAFAPHLVDTLARLNAEAKLGAGAAAGAEHFAVGLDNARYLVDSGYVKPGTERVWAEALKAVKPGTQTAASTGAASGRSLEQILASAGASATGTPSASASLGELMKTPLGVAVSTLTQPAEIQTFAKHLVDTLAKLRAEAKLGPGATPGPADFATGLSNARFLVDRGYVMGDTESTWRAALKALE